MTTSTPDQLPLLDAGAHLHPSDGACLMEYVSVLAGEGFSDHPRCTDPLLGQLARLVNDATSDTARPRLARFAPDLAAARRGEPGVAPAVVAATLAAASAVRPDNRGLSRQLDRAGRRVERCAAAGPGPGPLVGDLLYRRGAAPRSIAMATAALAGLRETERDPALASLLDAALKAHARARSGAAACSPSTPLLTSNATERVESRPAWRRP
jgi:hypothetical protein